MNRYIVEDWVCDFGIWDNIEGKFVGNPIDSFRDANMICDWFNSIKKEG